MADRRVKTCTQRSRVSKPAENVKEIKQECVTPVSIHYSAHERQRIRFTPITMEGPGVMSEWPDLLVWASSTHL